jgi:thioredoxin reductase (NADPH)
LYYGAASSESVHCRDERVYVVVGANSAGQAAVHLAEFAERVVLLARCADLSEAMSQYLVARIQATPRIDVRLETEVQKLEGGDRLEAITVANRRTGAVERLDANYVFVFIGATPPTGWLKGSVALDPRGFVLARTDLRNDQHLRDWPLARDPCLLVACPGQFCSGFRSAAPGWQGATTENTGSIRGRSNAANRDAPPESHCRND